MHKILWTEREWYGEIKTTINKWTVQCKNICNHNVPQTTCYDDGKYRTDTLKLKWGFYCDYTDDDADVVVFFSSSSVQSIHIFHIRKYNNYIQCSYCYHYQYCSHFILLPVQRVFIPFTCHLLHSVCCDSVYADHFCFFFHCWIRYCY